MSRNRQRMKLGDYFVIEKGKVKERNEGNEIKYTKGGTVNGYSYFECADCKKKRLRENRDIPKGAKGRKIKVFYGNEQLLSDKSEFVFMDVEHNEFCQHRNPMSTSRKRSRKDFESAKTSALNTVLPSSGPLNGKNIAHIYFSLTFEDGMDRLLGREGVNSVAGVHFGNSPSPRIGNVASCGVFLESKETMKDKNYGHIGDANFCVRAEVPEGVVPGTVNVTLYVLMENLVKVNGYTYFTKEPSSSSFHDVSQKETHQNIMGQLLDDDEFLLFDPNEPLMSNDMPNNGGYEEGICDLFDGNVLLYSCAKGRIDLVKFFIDEKGWNQEKMDMFGITPLKAAKYFNNTEVQLFLESKKASIKTEIVDLRNISPQNYEEELPCCEESESEGEEEEEPRKNYIFHLPSNERKYGFCIECFVIPESIIYQKRGKYANSQKKTLMSINRKEKKNELILKFVNEKDKTIEIPVQEVDFSKMKTNDSKLRITLFTYTKGEKIEFRFLSHLKPEYIKFTNIFRSLGKGVDFERIERSIVDSSFDVGKDFKKENNNLETLKNLVRLKILKTIFYNGVKKMKDDDEESENVSCKLLRTSMIIHEGEEERGALERIVEEYTRKIGKREKTSYYERRGNALLQIGRCSEAVEDFKVAVKNHGYYHRRKSERKYRIKLALSQLQKKKGRPVKIADEEMSKVLFGTTDSNGLIEEIDRISEYCCLRGFCDDSTIGGLIEYEYRSLWDPEYMYMELLCRFLTGKVAERYYNEELRHKIGTPSSDQEKKELIIQNLEKVMIEEEEEEEQKNLNYFFVSIKNLISIVQSSTQCSSSSKKSGMFDSEDNRIGDLVYSFIFQNIRVEWMPPFGLVKIGDWYEDEEQMKKKKFLEMNAFERDCPTIFQFERFTELLKNLARMLVYYNAFGEFVKLENNNKKKKNEKSTLDFVNELSDKILHAAPLHEQSKECLQNIVNELQNYPFQQQSGSEEEEEEEEGENEEDKALAFSRQVDKDCLYIHEKVLERMDWGGGAGRTNGIPEALRREFPELEVKNRVELDSHEKVLKMMNCCKIHLKFFKTSYPGLHQVLKGLDRALHMRDPSLEVERKCIFNEKERLSVFGGLARMKN